MVGLRNVVIIGSGPAGYTAAIYAARASLAPVVIEGSVTAGGALMNTTDVENFPGFPQGIIGPDLVGRLRAQAERFGAELVSDDVVRVELRGNTKLIETANNGVYQSRVAVLAMGSGYRRLDVEGEERLAGRGVSWCATCDGFFFRECRIMVVGGGDSALEEATFLTRFASNVVLVHRRDELRASKVMQERAFSNDKIQFIWNREVVEIIGNDVLEGVTVRDVSTGEKSRVAVQGLFVAIGHEPRSALVEGQVEVDDGGYVLVGPGSTATNLPGVFAAGDVVDRRYRQAITAAGTGCAAGLDAERYLSEAGGPPGPGAVVRSAATSVN